MELASEMLIKAARGGLRIRDIEGGYAARIGESKLDTWSDGWRHLMLILLLAPDLLLIGPGLVLAAAGLLTLGLAFVQPGGVEIGSARWQPVFFSGIALVLGVQALLAGVVLAHASPVTTTPPSRFAFLDDPRLPSRALATGVLAIMCGLAIDVAPVPRLVERHELRTHDRGRVRLRLRSPRSCSSSAALIALIRHHRPIRPAQRGTAPTGPAGGPRSSTGRRGA